MRPNLRAFFLFIPLLLMAGPSLANWRVSGMSGTGPCTFLSREDAVSFIQNSDYDSGNKQYMLDHIQDCGGSGGEGNANGGMQQAASQIGDAIGQGIVHDLLGPSDEEKEQKRQQELEQQRQAEEQQRLEQEREAQAKAEKDREDEEKLSHLKNKIKPIGSGSDGLSKIKHIDENLQETDGTTEKKGPKIKRLKKDDWGLRDALPPNDSPSIKIIKGVKGTKTLNDDGIFFFREMIWDYQNNRQSGVQYRVENSTGHDVYVEIHLIHSLNANVNLVKGGILVKKFEPADLGTAYQRDPAIDWDMEISTLRKLTPLEKGQ